MDMNSDIFSIYLGDAYQRETMKRISHNSVYHRLQGDKIEVNHKWLGAIKTGTILGFFLCTEVALGLLRDNSVALYSVCGYIYRERIKAEQRFGGERKRIRAELRFGKDTERLQEKGMGKSEE